MMATSVINTAVISFCGVCVCTTSNHMKVFKKMLTLLSISESIADAYFG